MQQDTITSQLDPEQRDLLELQVFSVTSKDILICRYLLGQVNYRSVEEAINYLFHRINDTDLIGHDYIAN